MTFALPISQQNRTAASSAWRRPLLGLAVVASALLLLFRREAMEIVTIWWMSPTFNHCLLIVPILAWLVWQRREELGKLTPVPWVGGLALVAGGAGLWLVGFVAEVNLFRHAAVIMVLQGAVVTCLGKAVARGLLFPLFYALFLIPAGAEIVPQMQIVTARLTMVLLGWSGIPAHLDGIFISTAIGLFEVAEACAGVKFLIAMVAYGVLLAHLCFRSPRRRALFLLACVLVPILANGVRAWGTVYVAFRTSIEYATGFDHIIYGGIFFALVMAVLIGSAWPFFDRKAGEPWFDPARLQPVRPSPASASSVARAAALVIAVAGAPLLWSAATLQASAPVRMQVNLPQVPGWTQVQGSSAKPWQPQFKGVDAARIGHYRDPAGREVDLAIFVFSDQRQSREVAGFGQGQAPGWIWATDTSAPPGGNAHRLVGGEVVREVLTFYRIGDTLTGSEAGVKLEMIKARLLGGPQTAVAVLVSAQAPAGGARPRPVIDSFLQALGPVDKLADQTVGR